MQRIGMGWSTTPKTPFWGGLRWVCVPASCSQGIVSPSVWPAVPVQGQDFGVARATMGSVHGWGCEPAQLSSKCRPGAVLHGSHLDVKD